MEQKGSLPPIIEDESDDNLLPLLYQKELSSREQKNAFSNVGKQDDASKSALNSTSNSDMINETQLPYTAWKSKIGMKKSDLNSTLEMQSRVGKTLESFQPQGPIATSQTEGRYVPQNQEHCNRHIDLNLSESTGFRDMSNFSEPGKGMPNDLPDARNFNFSYNDTPKGYFTDSRRTFRDCVGNSSSAYRNFTPDFLPDQLRYVNAEKSCVQNESYSPYFRAPHTYSPQHGAGLQHSGAPNASAFSHSNYNGAQHSSSSCQKKCCNGPPLPQNINYCPPYSGFDLCSNKQLVKSHPEPSCECHIKFEMREKKREKLDKVRKKQISDLYRIVWLQNEQIIQVQNQLKKLMQAVNERPDEKIKRTHDNEHTPKVTHKGTSEKRMFNLSVIEENQNLLEKVSVGIMTSFIDTTKVTKTGKSSHKAKSRKMTKSSSSSASTECSSSNSSEEEQEKVEYIKQQSLKKKSSGRRFEDSIMLNDIEIPTVAENTSPNSSPPRIDLNDFESSATSSGSGSSESEDGSPIPPVGWTFYDKVVKHSRRKMLRIVSCKWEKLVRLLLKTAVNMMSPDRQTEPFKGKVNNMLNKSESESNSDVEVQKKTLEQIRKLGINLEQESPSSKRVTFNSPYNQKVLLPDSDTSMKMNALAVKYYKEEKSSSEDEPKGAESHQNNVLNNTNLSYATLRYLERYHLPRYPAQSSEKIEKEKKQKKKKEKIKKEDRYDEKKPAKKKYKSGQHSGKILDITAIKQQPKLLPKKQ